MNPAPNSDNRPRRLAYTIAEFAALFGKDRSWGYRQVCKKRVVPIDGFGVSLIPDAEVQRILGGNK